MSQWQIHSVLIVGLFALGTVVGSFLNVCIYRLPWQKSVIWPGSHCLKCWSPIAAQDNIPVVSWMALRGECRQCGQRISFRYPAIELLVGLLFAGVYLTDVVYSRAIPWGPLPVEIPVGVAYHACFVALLIAATFIDFDLYIIPDEITLPGMFVGLAVGAMVPAVRLAPAAAVSHWDGFLVGVIGLLVGGGMIYLVRVLGTLVFRREAMGFGDVTLLAMIGAFLGWQAAALTFFIAPFFGLSHALYKLVLFLGKKLTRVRTSSVDREIPYGPYLSMAAVALMLSWPWLWRAWAQNFFNTLRMVFLP